MTKNNFFYIFLCLFLTTALAVSCDKKDVGTPDPKPEQQAKPAVIQGSVQDEHNKVLTSVQLTLDGNGINKSKLANNGAYKFDSLQPGSYNISVKRNGYIELTEAITVTSGDTLIKNFALKPGTAYFNLVNDTVLLVSPYPTSFKIRAFSNSSWVVNSMNDWVIPEKPGTSGDDSITIRVAASLLDTMRQGKLTVKSGNIVKNITVKQLADVKLNDVTAIPGNNVKGIRDSVALLFNQPVTIVSIFPGYKNCQSEIRYSYTGNKVTFSYACAAIGGDYPFTITTINSKGDQYSFTFNVAFYSKAIDITGGIRSHFVNDADNSYWVVTDHPNALYKIDMTTMQVLNKYTVNGEVSFFTINPYNNKIYFSYRGESKLNIMDQDGTTVQVIDIIPDASRGVGEYGGGPYIYPVKLCFTKSGKGMIWLSNRNNPYWWFIDAANNHRIWYESVPGDYLFYEMGRTNYDQSKLILTYSAQNPEIGIFDPQLMSFSSYRSTTAQGGQGVNVIPSRKNGYVYSNELYKQQIVDPVTKYESSISRKGLSTFASVDFCYKPGKEKFVYYTMDGKIEVIDYSTANATSPVAYDALYYMSGLTATLNGSYLIMNRHDGNYSSKVFQVPAAWFD
jgi:hypothetical protein